MGMVVCAEQKTNRAIKNKRSELARQPTISVGGAGTETGAALEFCLSRLALVSLLEFSSPSWWRGHHEPTGLLPLSLQRVTLDRSVSLLRAGLIPLREVTIWQLVDVQHSKSDNGSGPGRNNASRRTLDVRTPRTVARRRRRPHLAWTGILTESLPVHSP